MEHNMEMISIPLSNGTAESSVQDQGLSSELGLNDEVVAPSIWDGDENSDTGNELMSYWGGRQETHHMFLRSYD